MADNEIMRELKDGTLEISVLVSAGSSRAGIRGIHGKAVKLAVHSAPERGKANTEAQELIAESLGLPVRHVRVVSGQASRNKVMRVSGTDSKGMQEWLTGLRKS